LRKKIWHTEVVGDLKPIASDFLKDLFHVNSPAQRNKGLGPIEKVRPNPVAFGFWIGLGEPARASLLLVISLLGTGLAHLGCVANLYSQDKNHPARQTVRQQSPDLSDPTPVARARVDDIADETSLEPDATSAAELEQIEPKILRRPLDSEPNPEVDLDLDLDQWVDPLFDAPRGYTGLSGIAPEETQSSGHFVPVEDRWRSGFPEWDRYGKGAVPGDDVPYESGNWWDPYNQNVLKGDYPVVGQHTFLNVTATNFLIFEPRSVPTPTTPFESTTHPDSPKFFGNPNQLFVSNFMRLSLNLSHGNASFKPPDWQIRLTPVLNMNYLDTNELGIVSPNVQNGTTRFRSRNALEEYFYEQKLADLSPEYDFVSVRAGSQQFVSDFRGFIFNDTNRGVRLFGTAYANKHQYNLVFFDQTEKDTNSQLNTFKDRGQNTVIANYYIQDFIFPGYTAQSSFHYNRDQPSLHYDANGFLVRPDPVGAYRKHQVEAYYFGNAGDGHIGRVNVSHAFYWVVGNDSFNPLAGRRVDINAQMAALELSYDRDWVRFRTSVFYSSGDKKINDRNATGFDTILDNPNFAGGGFSYWQRQQIGLLGTSLVNRLSLVPDLRSSKFQGQSNFVNPGLQLFNVGADFDVTPKFRLIQNTNFLFFDNTNVLEQFTFQNNISRSIGTDVSLGMEYRPFLNNNVVLTAGTAFLLPGAGFKDLYRNPNSNLSPLYSTFMELDFTF
jgi:hypothetical protein